MGAQDSTPDSTADQGDGGRWMAFADLADARRISKASAIKLVRRHGWRRQRDNKGNVLALVPLPWAQDTGDAERDNPPDSLRYSTPDSTADISHAISSLEAAIAALRTRSEADLATITALHAQIETERQRADRAEQGREDERARADALRDRLNVMQAQLADAHAALQRAETADARVEQAERDKERAEQGREDERVRADALRERLDGLTGKLSDAQAVLASAQDQAATAEALQARIDGLLELWKAAEVAAEEARQQASQAAETTADVLRTEDARRRQGLMARLRAAWRGE